MKHLMPVICLCVVVHLATHTVQAQVADLRIDGNSAGSYSAVASLTTDGSDSTRRALAEATFKQVAINTTSAPSGRSRSPTPSPESLREISAGNRLL